MLLCAAGAHGQGTYTPVYNYGYEWQRGNFLVSLGFPGDTTRPHTSKLNNPHWGYKNGQAYFWDPLSQSFKPAGGGVIDTILLATRARLYKALDSISGNYIKNQTTSAQAASFRVNGTGEVGGAFAAGGFGTFAGGKVVLWSAGGNGLGDFYDATGNPHTSINANYGGNVTTNRVELGTAMTAPTAPVTNTGFFYMKAGGLPYWYYNGTETAIALGGGSSSPPAVQTFTDGATITLNYTTTSGWKGTIAGNRSFTLSNIPSNGVLNVTVTQDATGTRVPTFSGVTWLGTPPDWPTAGGKSTVCSFWNDGATIWGTRQNQP